MVKYDRPDDLKQVGKHEAVLWPPDCGITERFQGGSTSVFLRPTFPWKLALSVPMFTYKANFAGKVGRKNEQVKMNAWVNGERASAYIEWLLAQSHAH